MIGGTGPTGIPLVRALVEGGHDVTLCNRGLHRARRRRPRSSHHHRRPVRRGVAGRRAGRPHVGRRRRDVRAAPPHRRAHGGPLRALRVRRRRARVPGLDERVAARPARAARCRCGRTRELVADPAVDEKGYRIVRTEEAVFAAHPTAAHFRYPYLYGPYQLVPREWSIVRRILDGRRRIVVADDGLTLHHHGYTENLAAAVALGGAAPGALGGDDLQRRPTRRCSPIRQVVELCATELGAELEIVSMPYDLAVPAWPLLAQPSADPPRARPDPPAPPARPPRRRAGPRRGRGSPPAGSPTTRRHPGGQEEIVLTDPFDYAAEDALIDAWAAARAVGRACPSSPSARATASRTAARPGGPARTRSSRNDERSAGGRPRPRPVDRPHRSVRGRAASPTRAPRS